MPGLSGLELAAARPDLPPVVFTTAYDRYAVEAFQVSAVDYLLKPVDRGRLEAAIAKVRRQSATLDAGRFETLLRELDRRMEGSEPIRLCARRAGTTRFFAAADIARIHASSKYSVFRHDGREFVLDESLNALEARLGAEGFLRVHRAELVNLAHVRALHGEDGAFRLELSDGQSASVSRRLVAQVKRRLGVG